MMASMYYILMVLTLVFFFIILYFTVRRMDMVDKTGREYNGSFFIAVPLIVVNMIFIVILSYQSWNVETAYIDAIGVYQTYMTEMPYMVYLFFSFFLMHLALMAWNSFNFLIDAFYEPKGKWVR